MTATTAKAKTTKSKKAAKVKDALITLVLDESGSMGTCREATLEGVNAFLDEQRSLPGKTHFSLILFDNAFKVVHVAADLAETPVLGSAASPYNPAGGTALLDAVGAAIQGVEAWLKNNEDFDGKVIVVINTDGEENSSRVYSHDGINALISDKTAQGWDFIFLGAGTSAWTEGAKFTSIPTANINNFAYNDNTVVRSYASTSSTITSSRL